MLSREGLAPATAGLLAIDHFVPFHRSANVPSLVPDCRLEFPTAVHASGAVHDTPVSPGKLPGGFGVATVDQIVPFHRRARVVFAFAPTAMQFVTVEHDTELSPPALSDIVHVVPSHRHAFPCTAMHIVLLGHDTLVGAISGAATTDQVAPSQRSAKILVT